MYLYIIYIYSLLLIIFIYLYLYIMGYLYIRVAKMNQVAKTHKSMVGLSAFWVILVSNFRAALTTCKTALQALLGHARAKRNIQITPNPSPSRMETHMGAFLGLYVSFGGYGGPMLDHVEAMLGHLRLCWHLVGPF